MSYKPDGYPDVSPYLLVRDARRTLAFLQAVFGARPGRIIERTDGGEIAHAEARIGDCVIMMGETPEGPNSHVHIYIADAEKAFERAIQTGASVVQPIEQRDDDDIRGGVNDGNGVVWWISRQDNTA